MFPGLNDAIEKLGVWAKRLIEAIDRHTDALDRNTEAVTPHRLNEHVDACRCGKEYCTGWIVKSGV